jgi:hypothetical protein
MSQHITDRINLICAQNNLGQPQKNVTKLLNLACEVRWTHDLYVKWNANDVFFALGQAEATDYSCPNANV